MPRHPNQTRARFRRPLCPSPIEAFELPHPGVRGDICGSRVLVIADLHLRRRPGERSAVGELIDAVARTPVDLVLLAGDYMHHPGHEDVALDVLGRLLEGVDASLGVFGIFGNHDSAEFRERANGLKGVRWLLNETVMVSKGLRLVGASFPEDLTRAVLDGPRAPRGGRELVLGLSHYPNELIAASELGIDMLFAGHTHGGQWRIGSRLSPHTSCDLPWHQASGVLRYRQSLCVISRGLGEAVFEQRICCARHAPLVTLRQGAIPGAVDARVDEVRRVMAW